MKVITDHYGIENINSNAIAMVLLAFILLVNLTGVKAIKKVQIPIVTGAMAMVVVLCIMALARATWISAGPLRTSIQ